MESTKRAVKFQLNESKISVLKFWAVILIVDIFILFVTKHTDVRIGISEPGIGGDYLFSLMGFNLLPIIVYLTTYNYELYYKSFPISLSFSMTRKDFFKSMVVNNIAIAFITAAIQAALMKIDPILLKVIGKDPIFDFKLFNVETDSIIFIMISILIISIVFIAIWNLIAALNYKLGPKLWIVLGVISVLIPPIQRRVLRGNLIFPVDWLNVRIDILQVTIFSIITILLYIAIYFVTMNTNIKNKA